MPIAAAPQAVLAPRHARTVRLLEGPVIGTLVRLAIPNILVMMAQSATGLVETAYVGRLGTDALAGMSLVFPGVMLMQMIGAGAMGGRSRRRSRARSGRDGATMRTGWCCMRWRSMAGLGSRPRWPGCWRGRRCIG